MNAVFARLAATVIAKLRPDRDELYRLVVMETDPAHARRFEQLAPGPLVAFLALIAVGVFGALSVPVRLMRRS